MRARRALLYRCGARLLASCTTSEGPMPWTMEFTDDERILRVTYQGDLREDELRGGTHQIIAAMVQHKCQRALLDCLEARMEVPALNVYQLPDVYDASGIGRQVRAAVVLPRDGYKRELYEFYEDVCRNRGYFVKLFETMEEAWTWIRSENPS